MFFIFIYIYIYTYIPPPPHPRRQQKSPARDNIWFLNTCLIIFPHLYGKSKKVPCQVLFDKNVWWLSIVCIKRLCFLKRFSGTHHENYSSRLPEGVQKEEIQKWLEAPPRPGEKETLNIMLRE